MSSVRGRVRGVIRIYIHRYRVDATWRMGAYSR